MCEWFVAEKRLEMCEWFVAAKSKMAISEERINHKRQPITRKHFNLMQYVHSTVHSMLSFLF